ncbi:hypothetical protein P3S68_000301 [Capsicum galapagoense]
MLLADSNPFVSGRKMTNDPAVDVIVPSTRYDLECIACGNSWYASRDEAASLTIGPNLAKSVGAEPLATAKFEDVEKNLTSPRRADKEASDILKNTTEAYMPVLDSQKSLNKTKPEDSTTTSNAD